MSLLSEPELQAGVAAGAAGALAVATALEVRRHVQRSSAGRRLGAAPAHAASTADGAWPYGGIVVVLLGLAVLGVVGPMPWEVVLGVAGTTAAVDLAAATGQRTWVRAAAGLPFAAFIASSPELPSDAWFQLAVVVAIAGGGALAGATDTTWRREAAAPVLAAVAAAGIYAAVPDTEHVLVVVGILVPFAALAWPWPVARLGAGGAAGTVALIVWAAAYGARGRPPSVLGAIACLGLLLALAVGPRIPASVPSLLEGLGARERVLVLGGLQAVVALFAARTAGLQSELLPSVVLSIPPAALAVAIAATIRPPTDGAPDPGPSALTTPSEPSGGR